MKKLTHHHPRGLIAAITVLVCCADAARAAIDQNKGTNAIAFTEQRGDRSANLVLSTLDLAMMDPVERETMLSSLETQFGKPKVWASRAARSTSESVFAFARDGTKEKYGVRLRARQEMPVFSSALAEVMPAEKAPAASRDLMPTHLLGVRRSEVLTWTANQDNYTGDGTPASYFNYSHSNVWMNPGFNYRMNFGGGFYTIPWYGFSIKTKLQADVTGRFDYSQFWYQAIDAHSFPGHIGNLGLTRDVASQAAIGSRMNVSLILSWGHDWNLAWAGYWGMGAEASISIGLWPSLGAAMYSTNTSNFEDAFAINSDVNPYVEAQGTVWIGRTEHKERDDDIWNSESHKLVAGARGQIVFQGRAGVGFGYKCTEYDWYNDKWNNSMRNAAQAGNTRADGKLVARAELRWGSVTFQNGYQIWSGNKQNNGWAPVDNNNYYERLDQLL